MRVEIESWMRNEWMVQRWGKKGHYRNVQLRNEIQILRDDKKGEPGEVIVNSPGVRV